MCRPLFDLPHPAPSVLARWVVDPKNSRISHDPRFSTFPIQNRTIKKKSFKRSLFSSDRILRLAAREGYFFKYLLHSTFPSSPNATMMHIDLFLFPEPGYLRRSPANGDRSIPWEIFKHPFQFPLPCVRRTAQMSIVCSVTIALPRSFSGSQNKQRQVQHISLSSHWALLGCSGDPRNDSS